MILRLSIGGLLLAFVLCSRGHQTAQASPEHAWQMNYGAFRAHFTQAMRRGEDLQPLYSGKRVCWRMRFMGFPTQWRGYGGLDARRTLLFEPQLNPDYVVRMHYMTVEEHLAAWRAIPPGTWVTVRARISVAWSWGEPTDRRAAFEIFDVEAPIVADARRAALE